LISPVAARAYLDRDRYHNLMLLGALDFETVRSLWGYERDGELAALALSVEQHGPLPEVWPTIMLVATDGDALAQLLTQNDWPAPATWTIQRQDLLPILEERLGSKHDPVRGLLYYIATTPPHRPHPAVRRLTFEDADTLDLTPCALSPTALRNWLKRGWRIFGFVKNGELLGHALAAYPIGDTEEVSAVYTAPRSRGQGIASAVVAAAVADIMSRGHRAVYVTTKANIASQKVATGVGFVPLFETWDVLAIDYRSAKSQQAAG
jgi:ribosomal protein S18 acetylase RimI-like enzyme